MKKEIPAVFLLLLMIFIPLASAAFPVDMKSAADDAIRLFQDTFGPFFEAIIGVSQFDATFFAAVLLLILLIVIIYTILSRIDLFIGRPAVTSTISIIVAVLGIRFLPENFINAILLPYGTVATAIAVLLPFIIYFFFVHQALPGTFGRRAGWAVFGIIYFILWFLRGDEFGSANWMYILGLALVILAFIFDRTIHQYFDYASFSRAQTSSRDKLKRELLREINQLGEDYKRNLVSHGQYTREMNSLKRRYKSL